MVYEMESSPPSSLQYARPETFCQALKLRCLPLLLKTSGVDVSAISSMCIFQTWESSFQSVESNSFRRPLPLKVNFRNNFHTPFFLHRLMQRWVREPSIGHRFTEPLDDSSDYDLIPSFQSIHVNC